MKKWLLGLMCLVISIPCVFAYDQPGLKTLWSKNLREDYATYGVYYTSDTVLVVYTKKDDEGFYLDKLSYCSGVPANSQMLRWSGKIIYNTIKAYENRIFFVGYGETADQYNLICENLNLEVLWKFGFSIKDKSSKITVDPNYDYIIFNAEGLTRVFELKSGLLLTDFKGEFIKDSVYNGNVLELTDKLYLVDPYTNKNIWSYDLPEFGLKCFGIRNGIVMLSTYFVQSTYTAKVIILDADIGKDKFIINYDQEISTISTVSNLLLIVRNIQDRYKIIDAFDMNGWSFAWSKGLSNDSLFLLSRDNAYIAYNPCGLYQLYKISIASGEDDFLVIMFMNSKHILFQANRIIVADVNSDLITAYIDESL